MSWPSTKPWMTWMKMIGLLLVGLALATASPDWTRFRARYGKQYHSREEERYRMSVYEQNQQFINDHNAQYENGEVTFNLAMNQFGDMTTDEINAVMNGLLPSTRRSGLVMQREEKDLPDTVDWRTKGYVTPVKDQKACGSCWAFSTTGSLEGQHFAKTGTLVSLSEQNLVDCSMAEGNHGCGGGLMDFAFKYIETLPKGLDTEESYPYEAKNGQCNYNPDNGAATVTSYVDVTHGSEDDLKMDVATVGPISVAIDASKPTFHFYHSGVYYEPSCSSVFLDHGVLAVGYGTDDNGGDYWLVKNSWNTSWGNQGYIKMSRNKDNNCGIASQASYPVV